MSMMPQSKELTMSDFPFLAYAQHMAATARSDAAKRMFELFLEQEKRCLAAKGLVCRHESINT